MKHFNFYLKKLEFCNLVKKVIKMEKEVKLKEKCSECFSTIKEINKNKISLPNIATDAIVIKKNREFQNCNKLEKDMISILLIERKNNPYKNALAFPGGFVDYNENPEEGCLRELLEEACIKGFNSKIFTMKSDPKRDPRKHVVSFIYSVEVTEDSVPEAADDALSARFYDLYEVFIKGNSAFAFDHWEILNDFIKKELNLIINI